MNYQVAEDAIRAWLVSAELGGGMERPIDADHIYFAHQNDLADPPADCFVVSVGDLLLVGVDAADWRFDPSGHENEEILFSARGMRRLSVTIQCFTPETSEVSASPVTARAHLALVQGALSLPPIRDALNAAGLGLADAGTVRWLPNKRPARWEGFAVLEVAFHVSATFQARTGYIATVEGEGTVSSEPVPFTASEP